MAYEIPQQLQHKEKIIFGLTFIQLVWALVFGLFIFFILQLDASLTVKFSFALFPSIIGILFVFFDLSTWIKRLFYFVQFRSANLQSKKLKKLININKVDNDVIYSEKELAVLQITPLNFSIKTDQEKEATITGFEKFLNSLDFPIQFVVTTNTLNLDDYLAKLKKRVNNMQLFKDFSTFLNNNIKKHNMRNRQFYIIIPKHTSLDIQCKVCMERLQGVGLKVERVRNKKILENLRTFFNANEERSLDTDDGLHYLIAPEYLKDNVDSLQVNKKFNRIIMANGYPRVVESGFLDKIISSNDDFDISIHVEPFSIDTMMIILNKELQKQRADLYAEELKKSINPSLEIKYKDTRKVLEELQKGNQKLFNVSLYINCKAEDKEELDLLSKKVESELNSLMIVPSVPLFRQVQAFQSMIPNARDTLKAKRNITTKALSAFFPFTSPFLTLEDEGIMLGLNKNKIPYIKDIYGLSNANGVVLATSGSGKSYFTKLLISRQLMNDTQVMVIDPQAEYKGLVGQCKGQLITISRNSKTIINPLDLMGHEYTEKRLALMDMFKIMFGDLTEIQKSILDKAITQTYAKKGITADSYKNKKPPVLGDLYKVLQSMDRKASAMEKVTYRALLNRLYMYTDGVFGFLNKQSNINFNNNFVCFNIGDMPKQVKPVVMFLILDYVYMKMKQTKKKKLLVVDEAWSLLGKAEEASYIFEIVKTCRKFNMGLLLITQDVADLVNSKAGHAVLANSSYSLLLRQKPAVIDSVVKTFHLSQMEKEYLLSATQGKGILILDNEHQELEVVASPKEHQLIITNPNEKITSQLTKEDDRVDINLNLDLDKGLYYGKDLDVEQKNYLTNNGYKPGNFMPIGKQRREECWVKTNNVESIRHTFLVQNIKQEIQKHSKKVSVSITKEVDILLEKPDGKKFAIEVETGSSYKKNKKKLEKKFLDIWYEYRDNLVIVLTDKNYKRQYQTMFPHIQIALRKDMEEIIKKLYTRKKQRVHKPRKRRIRKS